MALIDDEYEITGIPVEIHADKTGRWSIKEPNTEQYAVLGAGDTMKQALAQARTELAKRKVTVEVPFVTLEGKRGVAYSIHAKERKPMVRWADGSKGTYDTHRGPFRADIPEETIVRYTSLGEQREVIERDMEQIVREYKFDLRTEVRKAIEEEAQKAATA